jgi:hypothetical protein
MTLKHLSQFYPIFYGLKDVGSILMGNILAFQDLEPSLDFHFIEEGMAN